MSSTQNNRGVPRLEARLAAIRDRIDAVSQDPGSVRVVAVTKGFGIDAVSDALALGLADIGENYAAELLTKAGSFSAETVEGHDAMPVWHFLGSVQRNKVAPLAPVVSWWQSVDRVEEGRAIARHHPGATVLAQVDLAGLAGRGGCPPGQVAQLVGALRDLGLDVRGLMAVGPPGDPEDSRPGFSLVSHLADQLELPERSMGMSDDLEVALSEGSTMVRLGRALFGDRPPRG
jgi:uncharacterized pyridoxal phosphate-containing UPF0001 family protein